MMRDYFTAVTELARLLTVERSNQEKDYQKFFEKYPFVLEELNVKSACPFEKESGNRLAFDEEKHVIYEPDLIGLDMDSELITVVELKVPFLKTVTTARSNSTRLKPKADLQSYLSQCKEYIDHIKRTPKTRAILKEHFGLNRLTECRGIVVGGLRSEQDDNSLDEYLERNRSDVKWVFYDDLYKKLVSRLSTINGNNSDEPLPFGVRSHHRFNALEGPQVSQATIAMALQIDEKQQYYRAPIVSWSGSTGNELEISIENHDVVTSYITSTGSTLLSRSPIAYDEPTVLYIEIGEKNEKFQLSLSVNGKDAYQTTGSQSYLEPLNLASMIMGASQNFERYGVFLLGLFMLHDKYLVGDDPLHLNNYLKHRFDASTGVQFNRSFMVMNKNGELVRRESGYGPVYIRKN